MGLPESSDEHVTNPSEVGSLRRLYVVALVFVACTALLSQGLVQLFLARQQTDAHVVNVAGRQRMLSQRIALWTLAPSETPSRRAQLASALADWERAHEALLHGVGDTLPAPSRAVEAQLLRTTAAFDRLRHEAHEALAGRAIDPSRAMVAQQEFLDGMERVVALLEGEALGRVETLRVLEIALFALLLVVLVVEARFVFAPAHAALVRTLDRLREKNDELDAARRSAESASRAKSDFLAVMGHEIRTPLHGVLGHAELLARTELDGDQEQLVETLATSGQRLAAVLTDVLDVADLDGGPLALAHDELDVAVAVERVVEMVRPDAEARGLRLTAAIAPETRTRVRGDALRIQQVALHYLTNALHYTAEGSVELRLATHASPSDRLGFHLEVRDTGAGIEPGRLAELFRPFGRLDTSTTRRVGGAGLGLAIVRRVVDAMNGEVSAESEVGGGSRFHARFELERVRVPKAERESGTGASKGLAGLRVLVADDSDVNVRLVRRVMTALGAEVASVGTGGAAVEACLHATFDLVLMDIEMPELDGFEATRRIRALPLARQPRIVAVTARSALDDREVGAASGMDAWLCKPFELAQLRLEAEVAFRSGTEDSRSSA